MKVDVRIAVAHQHKQGVQGHGGIANGRRGERAGQHTACCRLRCGEEIDDHGGGCIGTRWCMNVEPCRGAADALKRDGIRHGRTTNREYRRTVARQGVRGRTLVRAVHRPREETRCLHENGARHPGMNRANVGERSGSGEHARHRCVRRRRDTRGRIGRTERHRVRRTSDGPRRRAANGNGCTGGRKLIARGRRDRRGGR